MLAARGELPDARHTAPERLSKGKIACPPAQHLHRRKAAQIIKE